MHLSSRSTIPGGPRVGFPKVASLRLFSFSSLYAVDGLASPSAAGQGLDIGQVDRRKMNERATSVTFPGAIYADAARTAPQPVIQCRPTDGALSITSREMGRIGPVSCSAAITSFTPHGRLATDDISPVYKALISALQPSETITRVGKCMASIRRDVLTQLRRRS